MPQLLINGFSAKGNIELAVAVPMLYIFGMRESAYCKVIGEFYLNLNK
jgi:hypothetical protein